MPNILHRLTIDAPRERVGELAATRKGVQRWWTGHSVSGDDEVGGRFSVYFRDAGDPGATFEVAEPSPEQIVWRCVEGPSEWKSGAVSSPAAPGASRCRS
jgi:uncharacterized protein YndB with AHSA1/START domain